MKKLLSMACAMALGLSAAANAAVVGEPGPFADGSVDGWSGITVMDGYGSLPAGESVSTVNYYASPGRADGNHSVQPLIAKIDADGASIWDVGPVSTPDAGGDQTIDWTSMTIPDDGATYAVAFWQWNEGVNNTDGGLVPFAGDTGSGMFQADQDGTTYVPAVGDEIVSGHASGAGGRGYQMNFVTVPEPATAVMALLGLLPFLLVRRK